MNEKEEEKCACDHTCMKECTDVCDCNHVEECTDVCNYDHAEECTDTCDSQCKGEDVIIDSKEELLAKVTEIVNRVPIELDSKHIPDIKNMASSLVPVICKLGIDTSSIDEEKIRKHMNEKIFPLLDSLGPFFDAFSKLGTASKRED